MALCLSVCPPNAFMELKQRFPSAYPTLCYKEIRIPPSTSFWNFVYRTLKISPRKVSRVVNKTRRRPSLLITLTAIDASWLFTTRLSIAMLLPQLLRFVVQSVPPVVPVLTRFRLTNRVERSVCGSRISCYPRDATCLCLSVCLSVCHRPVLH